MKELLSVWKTKKGILRILISGVVFALVAAPFKSLFNLIPGVTEIRPANMVPVVFGLLWGPAGAWGICLSNAFTDIVVSHSPAPVWISGFIINFCYSYLPYKMWYSLSCGKGEVLPPSLESVHQIVKYVYICLVDSLVVTAALGLLFEAMGFQPFCNSYTLLFFNNFDFAIILGVPVIILLTSFHKIEMSIPVQKAKNEGRRSFFCWNNPFDAMLYLISAFGLFYLAAGKLKGITFSAGVCWILLAIIFVCMVLYLKKPDDALDDRHAGRSLSGTSIRAKVIVGFLLLSVAFTLMIGITTFLSLGNDRSNILQTWKYVYLVVGIALNVLFLISVIFLQYVEKNITGPMEVLTEMTLQFAGRDHKDTENNRKFIESVPEVKTGDEVQTLSDSFREMMKDITDYVENLETVTRENERIGAELDVATQIQADMLPSIFPAFPDRSDFDIYATMDPAREVGGDFYDFFLVDDTHLAVVIADVSGKGVPAALFMVIAKTLIKNHAMMNPQPAEVFTTVNNQLCEGNEAGLFVTAWLGIVDLTDGSCVYANAGHNPPLVRHGDGRFEYLKSPACFVLAGMEDMQYKQCTLKFEPGDKLYLYTDGVPEAENTDEELFGEDRLSETINRIADAGPKELIAGITKDLQAFVGEADQFDDITMVALTYTGKENK